MEKVGTLGNDCVGAFGAVNVCARKDNGEMRAVKRVKKIEGEYDLDLKDFVQETNMLRKIPHPNIVQIYEMFEDEVQFYIVTELFEGTDLFSRIEKLKRFSEKNAAHIMEEVLMAINHCHAKKICHRDLKPENILINDEDVIKVIDFGTAGLVDPTKGITGLKGTSYYVAPEVLDEAKSYN